MPYTLSHAAAVLPLRGWRRLSQLGLFVGAISPDLEHTLRFRPASQLSHTLLGLFVFCVPMGLWLFYALDRYGRPALAEIFPDVSPVPKREPWGWVALSVWLGALTHLVWDSFTHHGRWGTELLPWLQDMSFGVRHSNLLQHTSTVIGALLLALCVRFRWRPLMIDTLRAAAFSLPVSALVVGSAGTPHAWLVTFACNLVLGYGLALVWRVRRLQKMRA